MSYALSLKALKLVFYLYGREKSSLDVSGRAYAQRDTETENISQFPVREEQAVNKSVPRETHSIARSNIYSGGMGKHTKEEIVTADLRVLITRSTE